MTSSALEIIDVTRRFDGILALDAVSLTVNRGSFVVLLGPSGSGKTTLLNIVGGFLEPTSGCVLIDGQDVTHIAPAKRPTTTVFQDYALFPHMSVGGNVGFGLAMRGVSKQVRRERVRQALAMVDLPDAAERKVHQLSGGQKQRIALARALVLEPTVLLLDEPLGALDLKLRRQMQEELKSIQKRIGTTFVHVTHDQDEAMAIADVIVVMNAGRIEDQGPPERIYLRPRTRFAANFMGESNFIDGFVAVTTARGVRVDSSLGQFDVAGSAAPGQAITLSLRPEHVTVGSKIEPGTGAALRPLGRGRVVETGFFGTHHQCLVALDGSAQPLRVRLPQKRAVTSGSTIDLFVDPAELILLTQ